MPLQRLSLLQLIVVLMISGLCLIFSPRLMAEDTEVYNELARCMVDDDEKYRFIFIVDNSGSMSSWEFTQSRNTINAVISEVLNSDINNVQVAVVQYGTNTFNRQHKYNVTVPFTDDERVATSWNRYFGPGSPRYWDLQDHQPASLSLMRRDRVYDRGGALDVSDATNVQFVFFTDAWRDYYRGCCSSLVNTGSPYQGDLSQVLSGFGEYDALKSGRALPNGLKAQFTILHISPNTSATSAAAAIASPGGSYMGAVENNPGDPEGPGSKPRRYVQGNFSVSDTERIIELVQQVIFEIKDATFTSTAPSVSVNAFNDLQHRNHIFFSVFQPGGRPRWNGNVKKFSINDKGVILDADNRPAVDQDTGEIAEGARSIWSDEPDGVDVSLGGYRDQLTNNRVVYTDSSAMEGMAASPTPVPVSSGSPVRYEALDIAQKTTSGQCVLTGEKKTATLTVSTDGITAESTLLVKPGQARLALQTSADITASIILTPKITGRPETQHCNTVYAGGSRIHQCEFSVSTSVRSMKLQLKAQTQSALVEYVLETGIPQDSSATSCGSVNERRKDFLSWLTGKDVFNDDGDDSFTDAHQFGADPLHSQSVLVTYSGSNESNAKEVLFVTDNMGMLHAIDPANNKGTVLWSYIPEDHLDNVSKIIINQAGRPKVYGLDGHMSVVQRLADGSSRDQFKLRNVHLYFGERRGGRNYYGLDVSNATSNGDKRPTVQWTIRGGEPGFTDLGQSWSAMTPFRVGFNCNASGYDCQAREVLVFSGGYDIAFDDPDTMPSGTLGNAIYIVDLNTGELIWSAGNNQDARGQDMHDLHLPIDRSIVSAPSLIDINGDGIMDILYAVDIGGKVWRVDFNGFKSRRSTLSATGGNIADLSSPGQLRRFYNTLDVSRTQPQLGRERFIIVTGSGFRAHPNDMDDTNNRIFALYDWNTHTLTDERASKGDFYRYFEGKRAVRTSDLDEAGLSQLAQYGMTLSASTPGEKFLQPSLSMNGSVIISSFVPGDNTGESCSLGNGRTYFLSLSDLQSTFSKPFVELGLAGIPPETSILHLPSPTICIGTVCAGVASPSSDDEEDDDCVSSNYKPSDFGSALGAGFSSVTCGLKVRHAYRSGWLEHQE